MTPRRITARKSMATATGRRVETEGMDMISPPRDQSRRSELLPHRLLQIHLGSRKSKSWVMTPLSAWHAASMSC